MRLYFSSLFQILYFVRTCATEMQKAATTTKTFRQKTLRPSYKEGHLVLIQSPVCSAAQLPKIKKILFGPTGF